MDFGFTLEQEQFRKEIRKFIEDNITPELREEVEDPEATPGPVSQALRRKMGEKGWLGIAWPKEYGGQSRSMIDQFLFYQELGKENIYHGGLTLTSLGMALIRVGTEEQKREYLPRILRGEADFAIGYTEPDAGTDLASLRTSAVRDGDEYVINGQKMFCTFAHYATHLWLLARTDSDAPKHRGCSLFLFPIDSPGISVRPIYTMSGFRTNEVFLDNVRLPASTLIGQENRGFHHVMVALDFERVGGGPYPGLRRDLDELIQFCKEFRANGVALFDDPVVQDRLVRLHIETELVRLITDKIAWMIENGLVPSAEASAQKVRGTELRQRLANESLQLMGMYGQLRRGSHRAPFNGRYLVSWLSSPLGRFGAGTNEIQRDIIAQRGLGLPRG